MRKVNKILMATTAILLCLVLISTSVVSGIFAKFVVKQSARTQIKFGEFGVDVVISHDPTLATNGGATVSSTKIDNDTVSISVTGLEMVPGDYYREAIRVQVTGTPNVDVNFKIACSVDYDWDATNGTGKYVIPKSVSGYTTDTYFMPLAFAVKYSTTEKDVCRSWHNKTADEVEDAIIRNTANEILGASYTTSETAPTENGYSFHSKEYKADNAITGNIQDFYLGFYWIKDFSTKLNNKTLDYNAMATYLAEQDDLPPITFTYTFSLTQARARAIT